MDSGGCSGDWNPQPYVEKCCEFCTEFGQKLITQKLPQTSPFKFSWAAPDNCRNIQAVVEPAPNQSGSLLAIITSFYSMSLLLFVKLMWMEKHLRMHESQDIDRVRRTFNLEKFKVLFVDLFIFLYSEDVISINYTWVS